MSEYIPKTLHEELTDLLMNNGCAVTKPGTSGGKKIPGNAPTEQKEEEA